MNKSVDESTAYKYISVFKVSVAKHNLKDIVFFSFRIPVNCPLIPFTWRKLAIN